MAGIVRDELGIHEEEVAMPPTRALTSCTGLAAATALLISAPAAAQIEAQVTGCYDMHVGEWTPHAPGADSIYFMPPARVRLALGGGTVFGNRPRGYAVETVAGAMPSVHPYSFWSVLGPDSIAVAWTTGFAGVTMRFVTGDTMFGKATTGTDVVGAERFSAEVHAVRVDCDAPLPEASRAAYRYSPVVRLAGGDSLVLEHALGPDLPTEARRDRVLTVLDIPAGPYHGAHAIDVRTREDGSILSINLHYPDHIGFDDLLQRLAAEYGDPTSGPRRTPRESAIWSDRLMTIALSRGTGMRISIATQRSHR